MNFSTYNRLRRQRGDDGDEEDDGERERECEGEQQEGIYISLVRNQNQSY